MKYPKYMPNITNNMVLKNFTFPQHGLQQC